LTDRETRHMMIIAEPIERTSVVWAGTRTVALS